MGVYLALLRGINVGGKNKLPMKELVPLFEEAGCNDVRTYIQSGNVIFSAKKTVAQQIPTLVSDSVQSHFELNVPVVIRDAAAFQSIINDNPFLKAGVDIAQLHVSFLANKPTAKKIAQLDPHRSSPDEFVVTGKEIYLRCPNGVARTKLTNAYFDTKLETTSTMRNWKTVVKLDEMMGGE